MFRLVYLLLMVSLAAKADDTPIDIAESSVVRILQRDTSGSYFLGSGFVVANSGSYSVVVTNAHVVKKAEKIRVLFKDNLGKANSLAAIIRKTDQQHDLALLEVAGLDLPVLNFAQDYPAKGSPVYSIGFPVIADGNYDDNFGTDFVEATVTSGVLSRLITPTEDGEVLPLVQHSAVMTGGNSGGPVINACGEVIGINDAVATDRTPRGDLVEMAGFGYAIQGITATEFIRNDSITPVLAPKPCISSSPISTAATRSAVPLTVDNSTAGLVAVIFGGVIIVVLLTVGIVYFFNKKSTNQKKNTSNQLSSLVKWGVSGTDKAGRPIQCSVRENRDTLIKPLIIGRDISANLFIDDPTLSRRHAQLYIKEGVLYCSDLGSANGTKLDGVSVTGSSVRIDKPATLTLGGITLNLFPSMHQSGQ